jgi:hypothetical protein
MLTTEDKQWDKRRDALLGELVDAVADLGKGKAKHVSTDMNHVYVHFFDEDGEDIGNLSFFDALSGLWNDVYLWNECSTAEDPETGEPLGDLNIKDAVRLELQTH